MLALRLRWALRDAKSRWVQIAGIAFMIAIGTGMFAGLSSVTQWRFASNDASLALTNMYDIRARPSGDGFLPQGSLAAIAEGIDGVEAVEERFISPTQVEVDTGDGSIFVRARVIGVDMSDGGPSVNGVELITGREIKEAEFGEPVVLIERNFGVYYELPDEGELQLGGGVAARYVGHAVSPEYFLIVEEGGFFGQASLAVVFTSIETAQELSGRQGQVNDLVLTVDPGTDLTAVETALVAETAERHPDTGLDLMRTEDDASYLALTRDPEGDQQFYNVFALILFAGAAFASLNFAARMVETQRREIGTSMALGENPVAIAVRPLLVGVQIALLGVVFGIGMGLLITWLMKGVLGKLRPTARLHHALPDGYLRRCRGDRIPAAYPRRAVARLPRGSGSAGGRDQDRTSRRARRRARAGHQPPPPAGEQPGAHTVPQPDAGPKAHVSDSLRSHRRAGDTR